MNKCLITVIVPIFNEEKYIDRCMKSLENQSWKLLQIIMIDGGSTDNSPRICDEWARKWNSTNMGVVEVIHTSNKGVSASRNKGLSHASGEYITFVDGDDWLEPDAIALMYKAMRESDADLSGCSFRSRYDDPERDGRAQEKNNDVHKDTTSAENERGQDVSGSNETPIIKSAYNFIHDNMLHSDVHCWGRLYKRSLVNTQRFKEGLTIGEDMLFLLEYVLKCEKVVSIDNECYNYFRNPAGAMTKPFTEKTMDQVKCWVEAGELLSSFGTDDRRTVDTTTEGKNVDDARADINALSTSPDLYGNILISIMLTAGRLAIIDKDIRKNPEHKAYARQLKEYIKSYKNKESMKMIAAIPGAYPFKVRLFKFCPGLYLFLYGLKKS